MANSSLRANGSAQNAADDRLREAIQECVRGGGLDCLVARAPRNDEGYQGKAQLMSSKNRLDPIPQPPTKPVVGNMLSLDSAAPVQHLTRLAKELGPIFWLDMMGSPIVVVSGQETRFVKNFESK